MNIQDKMWKIGRLVGIMLFVFLIAVTLKELRSLQFIGVNTQILNSITVEGNGDAIAIPDIATFTFTVTETAKTVAEAQSAAATKINAALKAVKDGGVMEKDIQTISYNINPHYEYQSSVCTAFSCPPSKSVLTGYDVSEGVQVKIRDLAKAGTLFTAIGGLGVQNINGLNFSVDKPETVQAEARAEAIKNAQDKAKELARQLGVSLVKITSYYESGQPISSRYYGMGGDKISAAAPAIPVPEIAVGEQKVTSNVTITYEIR